MFIHPFTFFWTKHTRTRKHTHAHTHTQPHTHIHTHIHTHNHTHTHTHTHVHACTHARSRVLLWLKTCLTLKRRANATFLLGKAVGTVFNETLAFPTCYVCPLWRTYQQQETVSCKLRVETRFGIPFVVPLCDSASTCVHRFVPLCDDTSMCVHTFVSMCDDTSMCAHLCLSVWWHKHVCALLCISVWWHNKVLLPRY